MESSDGVVQNEHSDDVCININSNAAENSEINVLDSDAIKVRNDLFSDTQNNNGESEKTTLFKKPVLLVGPRRGKTVGKLRSMAQSAEHTICEQSVKPEVINNVNPEGNKVVVNCPEQTLEIKATAPTVEPVAEQIHFSKVSPAQKIKEISLPLPYREPKWSGLPELKYSFEVLKLGTIIENIDLSSKSFFVFGRLSTCDIHMAHPTVSRYHAVLQYRKHGTDESPAGFYIYDLGSTHGTFLNRFKIKPNMYVRIKVGHMLKLGSSMRMFILQGPDDDMEEESELTVTQLKEKRKLEIEERELKEMQIKQQEEENRKHIEEKEASEGIDWGMGEDADEETDLSENPYAVTQNEELYIDDPKKTLRGWFEREGYELEYNVEERGFSQFACRVELPIGNGMTAEAFIKGKKKEAVVQCALEACRILDRYGMLRQAKHESRKRKERNWEDDDYYDSDDDTFLDRTGTVEKKRHQRMQAAGKLQQEIETYETLLEKHKKVLFEIQKIQEEHEDASKKMLCGTKDTENDEEDALDAYMTTLSSAIPDKKFVNKLKNQLQVLKSEEEKLRRLVNIARPATLPELKPFTSHEQTQGTKLGGDKAGALLNAVKRKACSEVQRKPASATSATVTDTEKDSNDEEEEEDDEKHDENDQDVSGLHIQHESDHSKSIVEFNKDSEVNLNCSGNETTSKGNNEIIMEVKSSMAISSPSLNSDSSFSERDKGELTLKKIIGPALPSDVKISENMKCADRNKRRNRKKFESKDKKGKSMDNSYDSSDPDYSVWVPPAGQTGDGRTKLNEKYGY